MMQLNLFDENDEVPDQETEEDRFIDMGLPLRSRCESLSAQCDSEGKFLPAQCDSEGNCWCVDEAGNQLLNTSTFKKGKQLCCK